MERQAAIAVGQPDAAGVVTVRCENAIDLSNAEDLSAAVGTALATSPDTLVLDLTRVTFMDSPAVSAVVAAKRVCEGARVSIVTLATRGGPVQRLLNMAGVDAYVNVEICEPDADVGSEARRAG
jgi:anti-anti-sigma factor